MARKNKEKKRIKRLTFKEEYDIWRKKMTDLARSEPIHPEMERIAKRHGTGTRKYQAAQNKKRVTLYDASTDFKKIIHKHWDKKYGQSISGHQHSN